MTDDGDNLAGATLLLALLVLAALGWLACRGVGGC